jgi:hypothetical protein
MITKDDGTEVMLDNLTCSDTALDVEVARVNIAALNSNRPGSQLLLNTVEFRRVIRECNTADNRMDLFVVGAFTQANLLGRAFVPGSPLDAAHTAHAPVRWGAILRADVMDNSDSYPFVTSHEVCHVLYDSFHTKNTGNPGHDTELMHRFAQANNSANGSKRMCDNPIRIIYYSWDPAQPDQAAAVETNIQMVTQWLKPRSGPVTEGW